ncbi:MAG: hypothetical protein WBE46_06375 [Dehalococcoidia bacterium]
MKQAFLNINFGAERQSKLDLCNEIINTYLQQGLRLTLRQLYYQLVSINAIPNRERAYKSLGKLVSDARLAGDIDWDAIEDRVRIPREPTEFADLAELVDAAIKAYRLPRWEGQGHYIELWVEKDALSGVLAPLASQYHVTLMVNREYSSQSAMYEAGQRFNEHSDQDCVLLYLGDHDPSGEDMVRDIADRLRILAYLTPVKVVKVALTWEQVQRYNPPPNPAKITDSRSNGYIAKYGSECWEVDALRPDILQSLIREAIGQYVNMGLMDWVKDREQEDKARLKEFIKGLNNGS